MKYTWLIDSGHGGMINGEYQTAPNKMFTHSNGEVFYEGVWNREIKDMLIHRLWSGGIPCIDLCPTELDLGLGVRVENANTYHLAYENCILLSIHSNASPLHNATGMEVFAFNLSKRSQALGNILGEMLEQDFTTEFRWGDGQRCKTSGFYILQHSFCPAILPECLFYDYYPDYQKLVDGEFKRRYVQTLVNFILKIELLGDDYYKQ